MLTLNSYYLPLKLIFLLLLLLSHFSHVQLCATPQMVAHQAPPSMRFFRQEYWSGLSVPSLLLSATSAIINKLNKIFAASLSRGHLGLYM